MSIVLSKDRRFRKSSEVPKKKAAERSVRKDVV